MSVPSAWTALAHGATTVSLPTSPSLQRMVTTALTQSAVAVTYAKLLLDELTDHQTARHLGSRTIGGVSATGTGVDLTLAQLLKLVPELSPTMTKAAARMADQTIPATVWVDRQGRLVEVNLGSVNVQGPRDVAGHRHHALLALRGAGHGNGTAAGDGQADSARPAANAGRVVLLLT